MKFLGNVGLLTNFEVFKLLEERGAGNAELAGSSTGASVSECKVYEYLKQTPASTQSLESVSAFIEESSVFPITRAERLQAINLRPISAVEVHLVVEDCEERLTAENIESLIEIVEKTLPPPPEPPSEEVKEDEEVEEGNVGTA